MFELIEMLDQAVNKRDDHYSNCDRCQKHTFDLNTPKCNTGFKLHCRVEKVKEKIQAFKIDIE